MNCSCKIKMRGTCNRASAPVISLIGVEAANNSVMPIAAVVLPIRTARETTPPVVVNPGSHSTGVRSKKQLAIPAQRTNGHAAAIRIKIRHGETPPTRENKSGRNEKSAAPIQSYRPSETVRIKKAARKTTFGSGAIRRSGDESGATELSGKRAWLNERIKPQSGSVSNSGE